MEKDQFNAKFDIAIHNALRQRFDQIKVPEDHVILESWKAFQTKLDFNRIETQELKSR